MPYIYAKNLNYSLHNIHTLTIPSNSLLLNYGYELLNDTVDVLKLKEREFGSNSNFDAMGDLSGHNINLRYGIRNDLMVSFDTSLKSIAYGNNNLENTKYDIFLRYNFFNHHFAKFNSGLSLDIGYATNQLNDFYFRDISQINSFGKRVVGNSDISISQMTNEELNEEKESVDSLNQLFPELNIPYPSGAYITDKDGNNLNLYEAPWIALKNSSDSSQYIRLLTGYYSNKSVLDFYMGYKKTKIKTLITANDELVALANDQDYDISLLLDRDEEAYVLGLNYTYETKNNIYEVGYEYSKFIRENDLDYIDFNHVIDISSNYKINHNLLLFVNAKILYRQLNGEIPYLYNKYTQTSYDHMYGYTKFGMQYRF